LQENKSEVQPDTIHADYTRPKHNDFPLAYLLGIELIPRSAPGRINTCSGPRRMFAYEHIDELFTAQVDWDLSATLLPDMMRVGRIDSTATSCLPISSDYSTAAHAKNKLYFGFGKLGRVVRTIFLAAAISPMPSYGARSGGH